LNELGVSCKTAAKRGWKALSNGELVSAAVVVVGLPQQRWQAHQEQFVAAWGARSIEPVAGTLVHWP